MKTTIIVSFCVMMIFAANAASQIKSNDSVNSLSCGKISLQFGIGANLTIGAFNGYAISCKYNLSQRTAVRLGIAGAFKNNRGNSTNDLATRNFYDYAYSYTIDPAFLMYFNTKSPLTFFAGAGPIVSYSYQSTKGYGYSDETQYGEETNWEAGAKVLIGCEWFLMSKVSLFADYEATFAAGHQKVTEDYYYTTGEESHFKMDTDNTSFRANTARFGLSVYF